MNIEIIRTFKRDRYCACRCRNNGIYPKTAFFKKLRQGLENRVHYASLIVCYSQRYVFLNHLFKCTFDVWTKSTTPTESLHVINHFSPGSKGSASMMSS